MTRALAVIDGEHYAPVVRDALAELPYDFVGAWFAGGRKRCVGDEDYGVPRRRRTSTGACRVDAELVFDLSGEPVLEPAERLLAREQRARTRRRVRGGRLPLRSAAVWNRSRCPRSPSSERGSEWGRPRSRVISPASSRSSGRWSSWRWGEAGRRSRRCIESPPTVEDLVSLSRAGGHAASDYLETAALAGVPTVGCRRCGGGMAGAVATSNVLAGRRARRRRSIRTS